MGAMRQQHATRLENTFLKWGKWDKKRSFVSIFCEQLFMVFSETDISTIENILTRYGLVIFFTLKCVMIWESNHTWWNVI